MKYTIALLIAYSVLNMSPVFAGCGGGGGCEDYCDANQTSCQCTDPMCNKPMYSNCISRAYCCEAFGNIGAR